LAAAAHRGETTVLLKEWFSWFISRVDAQLLNSHALRYYGLTALVLAITVGLEIAARRNWRVRYGSVNFRIDFLYYVFYYGGIYHFFVFAWMYKLLAGFVSAYAPWLQMNLLADMSPPVQMVAIIVAADLFGYWSHRLRHANNLLWSFHTIHHSQRVLTIMTNYRFHFVDETVLRLCLFIPFQILGTSLEVWLSLDFILAWVLLLQHSEWDWTYGPLGRVFVSPAFHRIHHAKDERLHNCNYAMLFSFWDDLFGTAERNAPPPVEHGLAGNPVPETVLGQIVYPFVLIARDFRRPARDVATVTPPIHSVRE
jgi:sterol desaturase/sphingolipid hydroxylase (fatty acid hydroxylase superfamily)